MVRAKRYENQVAKRLTVARTTCQSGFDTRLVPQERRGRQGLALVHPWCQEGRRGGELIDHQSSIIY